MQAVPVFDAFKMLVFHIISNGSDYHDVFRGGKESFLGQNYRHRCMETSGIINIAVGVINDGNN